MDILDNPHALKELDSMDSLAATAAAPRHLEEGLALAKAWQLPPHMKRKYHEILVLGTGGGSSIAGALIPALFSDQLRQPVLICQDYELPAYADTDTLVIAVSHSGNTEEILTALGQARHRGCPALAVTAGGALAEICRAEDIPFVLVPRDIGHPRRNLGQIAVPILLALAQLGLVPDLTSDISEAAALLEELNGHYGPHIPQAANPAKALAARIKGHIPLVYASQALQAVAWRWKNQLGENSKLMAFYNLIPHLHHDEAVGWDMERPLLKQFFLVMLRDKELDSPKVAKRKDITTALLQERLGGVQEVWAQGNSRLARLFSLIHLGDYVSLYAAIIRGIDPTPVPVINLFKEKMGQ